MFSSVVAVSCQVLSMKKTSYKDSYGDGVIEAVAKQKCGGEAGAFLVCLHQRLLSRDLFAIMDELADL